MKASICYTKRAPEGKANGIDVGAGFALNSAGFRVQHGAVRSPSKQTMGLHNELVPCQVEIRNARELDEKPSLSKTGFELVEGLSMPSADDIKDTKNIDEYFEAVEQLVLEKTGASFAKVFCQTARNVSKNPSGAGNWAHTGKQQRGGDMTHFPRGFLIDVWTLQRRHSSRLVADSN